MVGTLHRIDRRRPKIGSNPNILEYSKSPRNRGKYARVIVWVENMSWPKEFLTSHTVKQIFFPFLQNNRFRVPIHIPIKRFTFNKNLPPPQNLHPSSFESG